MVDLKNIVERLQCTHKGLEIAYGGDGTLADMWRKAHAEKLPIWPIRNYGLCGRHEKILEALVEDDTLKLKDIKFNITLHPLAECIVDGVRTLTLNEIQVKNNNITEAIRFNVYVNDKRFYENVIADGVLFSTPNGSTGYWKSITRTIFREGCGLAFIAPTVGISSLVLKHTDNVKLVFVRDADITLAYDKMTATCHAGKGFEIDMRMSSENVSIVGYDQFMCFDCRKNRNSTILQDQYIV